MQNECVDIAKDQFFSIATLLALSGFGIPRSDRSQMHVCTYAYVGLHTMKRVGDGPRSSSSPDEENNRCSESARPLAHGTKKMQKNRKPSDGLSKFPNHHTSVFSNCLSHDAQKTGHHARFPETPFSYESSDTCPTRKTSKEAFRTKKKWRLARGCPDGVRRDRQSRRSDCASRSTQPTRRSLAGYVGLLQRSVVVVETGRGSGGGGGDVAGGRRACTCAPTTAAGVRGTPTPVRATLRGSVL